jgi:hypothetical protein
LLPNSFHGLFPDALVDLVISFLVNRFGNSNERFSDSFNRSVFWRVVAQKS